MNQEEVWKDIEIEYISGYQVSNLGRVRKYKVKRRKYKELDNKLSGKHYTFGVVEICSSKSVARTVCEAFHGEAPGDHRLFDVAHRDGDPLNNHADNLYWITKSEHRKLQFNNDIYSANVHIDVKDIIDKELLSSDKPEPYIVHHFKSVLDASEFLGVHNSFVISMLKNYKDIPYKGQYLISTPTPERLFKSSRSDRRSIVFLNHLTGEIGEARSMSEASYMTGVGARDIANRCRAKDILSPIRGYEFHFANDPRSWTLFTDEEIMRSKREYELKLYG